MVLFVIITFSCFICTFCVSSWPPKSDPVLRNLEEDDVDGQLTLFVHHSLDSGPVATYEQRGVINVHLARKEASYYQDKPLPRTDIAKLRELAQTNGMYRVKVFTQIGNVEDQAVFSFTKACAIYESGLSDVFTVTLDQNGYLVGVGLSASPASCNGDYVPDSKLISFNTSVNIVSLVTAPAPDTLTYIQRMEQEKAEKARGEQGDNRSFFAKYWMYIVPLIIFLLISGASNPEGQGGAR